MPAIDIYVDDANYTHAHAFPNGPYGALSFHDFTHGLVSPIWFSFVAWLTQPRIMAVFVVWWISFAIFTTIVLFHYFARRALVHYGPLGPALRAWFYEAFGAAAWVSAVFTSWIMLLILAPMVATLLFTPAVAAIVVAYPRVFYTSGSEVFDELR